MRSEARCCVITQVTASGPAARSHGRLLSRYVSVAVQDISRQAVLGNHDSDQSTGGRNERPCNCPAPSRLLFFIGQNTPHREFPGMHHLTTLMAA